MSFGQAFTIAVCGHVLTMACAGHLGWIWIDARWPKRALWIALTAGCELVWIVLYFKAMFSDL